MLRVAGVMENHQVNRAFWLAAAAYLLPTFPLGYFWHLVTFQQQYERLQLYRDEVIIPFGLLSMAMQAVVFAWAYPRLFSTRRADWLRSALGFGVVFGLLAWSFSTTPVAAKYRMSSVADFMALESAFTALQFLIVAPLVALAYRQRAEIGSSQAASIQGELR
jgi:hypothetical protein